MLRIYFHYELTLFFVIEHNQKQFFSCFWVHENRSRTFNLIHFTVSLADNSVTTARIDCGFSFQNCSRVRLEEKSFNDISLCIQSSCSDASSSSYVFDFHRNVTQSGDAFNGEKNSLASAALANQTDNSSSIIWIDIDIKFIIKKVSLMMLTSDTPN